MLIDYLEDEINNYVTPRVLGCFESLESKLEGRYTIETNEMKLDTTLQSKIITINIDKYFKMSRGNKITEIKNFEVKLIHPIYDLAKIAIKTANQESQYCNFDYLGHMIIYPDYDIQVEWVINDKGVQEDKVYMIKEIKSNQEFKFAIRSCVSASGWGG
jgi:hypothetical protein